jgi:hypothetical protein
LKNGTATYLAQQTRSRTGGAGLPVSSIISEEAPTLGPVLNAIETGVADALLKSEVFDSVCGGGTPKGPFRRGSDRKLLRQTTESRQMRAVGLTSNPEDEIIESRKYYHLWLRLLLALIMING